MRTILRKAAFLSITSLMLVACGEKQKKSTSGEVADEETMLDIEKPQLKFGFIKLTDMAPLAIAKEKGFLKKRDSSFPWRPNRTGKMCWTVSSTGSWTDPTCWRASPLRRGQVLADRRSWSLRFRWT